MSLAKFNVIIGANASGKSNLAQIFKFLNDITLDGLDGAISQQGGMECLLNFTNSNSNLSYEITFNVQTVNEKFFIWQLAKENADHTKVIYRFEIQLDADSGVKIINDEWIIRANLSRGGKDIPLFELSIKNDDNKLKIHMNTPHNAQMENQLNQIKEYLEMLFSPISYTPKLLSLEQPVVIDFILRIIGDFCNRIEIYNFEPNLAKLPSPIMGTSDLEPDGGNLAAVMKNMMKDLNNRKMFATLIADVLPFVHSVDTEKLLDNSVMLVHQEKYFKNRPIPATLISDGTINVTALICALYFQNNPLVIIEEPERNMHPSLLSRIVDMIKDASSQKQIIVTTHSPEMIRYTDIENILLIRRDEEGNSNIIKPSNQVDVKKFLKNDMDIRELYVQNILDG